MDLLDFVNKLRSSDLASFIICLEALNNEANNQKIEHIGMNDGTGCVYVALENGIIINSSFGQRVTFTVMNHKNDNQEEDFDNYYLAENYLNTL
jgi:hypothetical protein